MSKRKREETETGVEAQEHHTKSVKTTPFPFLRLPAELRNLIYTYVFSGNIHEFLDYTCIKSFQASNLGLLLVSRQVHAECALLPYKLSTFSFGREEYIQCWHKFIRAFLQQRKEQQLKAIENMTVIWFGIVATRPATLWFRSFACEKKDKK